MSDFATGRTGWDMLVSSKSKLFNLAAIAFVLIGLYFVSKYMDMEQIEALIIGALLGWLLTSNLMKPTGRLVVVMDLEQFTIRIVFIPDEFYSKFNKAGNCMCFTSAFGMPVYLAKSIDLENNKIDYGWCHNEPIEVALSDIAFFNEWYGKYCTTQQENLIWRKRVDVMAAELAKCAVDQTVKEYDVALGLNRHEDSPEPVPLVPVSDPIIREGDSDGV